MGHECVHNTNRYGSSSLQHLSTIHGSVPSPSQHFSHGNESSQFHRPFSVSSMEQLMVPIEESINSTVSLTLPSANENLVFVLGDTDRSCNGELPHAVPIGYALKGSSLTSEAFRSMVIGVLRTCNIKGIYVPCTSYDGQWWQMAARGADGKPLTLIKLMRDLGHEAKRFLKNKMVQLLMLEIYLGMLDMERIKRYSIVDGENADEAPTVTAETDSVIPLPPTVLDSIDSSVIDVIQSLNCDKRSHNITTAKSNVPTTTWHEWYDDECGLFDESVPTTDNPTMENKPDDFAGSPSLTNSRQESPYVSDDVPPISETFDMERGLVTAGDNSIIPPTIHVLPGPECHVWQQQTY